MVLHFFLEFKFEGDVVKAIRQRPWEFALSGQRLLFGTPTVLAF
jgi:hypothetical protein